MKGISIIDCVSIAVVAVWSLVIPPMCDYAFLMSYTESRLAGNIATFAILAISFLVLPLPVLFRAAIAISCLVACRPTRRRLRCYLWRVTPNITNFGRPQQFLVFFSFPWYKYDQEAQSWIPITRAYSSALNFILSPLAADVLKALSDPGSTINDIAWRTCCAYAEGSEPHRGPPSPQAIANFFRNSPPNIHVKVADEYAASEGETEEQDTANEMVINMSYVDQFIGAFSYASNTQLELCLRVMMFREAVHCLTKHFYGPKLPPRLCTEWYDAYGDEESGLVAEILLSGGHVMWKHLPVWVIDDRDRYTTTVFRPGTLNRLADREPIFEIKEVERYLRHLRQRRFHTPLFSAGPDGLLKQNPALELFDYASLFNSIE